MTSDRKRRARRRKLKQHDMGFDRHNPGLNWIRKARRLHRDRGAATTRAKQRQWERVMCPCGHTRSSHEPGGCVGCTGPACQSDA